MLNSLSDIGLPAAQSPSNHTSFYTTKIAVVHPSHQHVGSTYGLQLQQLFNIRASGGRLFIMARIFSALLVSILVAASSFSAGEVLPAARINDTATTASFALGLSLAGSASDVTTALTTDDVRVTGIITP